MSAYTDALGSRFNPSLSPYYSAPTPGFLDAASLAAPAASDPFSTVAATNSALGVGGAAPASTGLIGNISATAPSSSFGNPAAALSAQASSVPLTAGNTIPGIMGPALPTASAEELAALGKVGKLGGLLNKATSRLGGVPTSELTSAQAAARAGLGGIGPASSAELEAAGLSRFSPMAEGALARAAMPLGVGLAGGQLIDAIHPGGKDSKVALGLGDAARGIGTGAAIGSIVPGIGTGVGALVGGVSGGIWGLLHGHPQVAQADLLSQQQQNLSDLLTHANVTDATRNSIMNQFQQYSAFAANPNDQKAVYAKVQAALPGFLQQDSQFRNQVANLQSTYAPDRTEWTPDQLLALQQQVGTSLAPLASQATEHANMVAKMYDALVGTRLLPRRASREPLSPEPSPVRPRTSSACRVSRLGPTLRPSPSPCSSPRRRSRSWHRTPSTTRTPRPSGTTRRRSPPSWRKPPSSPFIDPPGE